ncbi:nucleotide-binding universal stress UspA family protein [Paenibacillus shirakamiensis]|uniref:Nucleotide-binding universal stress UspA family protein n=1 Tax=Paenibacillus shirakamiensis TaxID=1265935 RepID=A0ABS4JIS0_9BACL|nr:universal stress protein [Paenibacillus shirakamiensis]MBP2000891.1 nucleotide-binding universal stress UspA family protein [Paenibacillus shirakamiensis]
MVFQKILLAYDGSDSSNKALAKAAELVKLSPESELIILHVYDFPRFYIAEGFAPVPDSVNMEFVELANRTTDEAKRRLDEMGVSGKVELAQGAAAEVILENAESQGADVIVVGTRGHGGIREFVLGSVSHNIVQHARIPVLVVK